MIKIGCIGRKGIGKTSVIKFLMDANDFLHGKKMIAEYTPSSFRKIIDIVKPKKYSFPQVEFFEISVDENVQTLTKYGLNTYDILIFVQFTENLNEELTEELARFIANTIKATDIKLLDNRIEKLNELLKFKHSENEVAELNSLSTLINYYKSNQKLELTYLDKISKNAVNTFGLLSFKPLCLFINTKYTPSYNKFTSVTTEGLNINIYACDFSLYSDLKVEFKSNPKIFEEFKVEYLDYSNIIPTLLRKCDIYHFYTIVSDDVRAWQITKGTPAKKAAGKIHKDFEKGFISAEIVKATDFINENGDMRRLKEQRKILRVNQHYEICDEDIVTFKFNV